MFISRRQWKKMEQKVIGKIVDARKNAFGQMDLTPYNAGRKPIDYLLK